MHRTGLKSSWCYWTRGGLSSSRLVAHLEKKIWSSSLWNSQNMWQSSFSTRFVLWLFFSIILWKISSRQCVIELCTFTKRIIKVANSRLEQSLKPQVESNPDLPCSCCLSHRPNLLLVLSYSSLCLDPASSPVDCGFRLGLFQWVLFKSALRQGGSLTTTLIKLLNMKVATMQQISAKKVNLDLNISSVSKSLKLI